MAKAIKPEQLGEALAEELTLYHKNTMDRVNKLSETAAKDLVKATKANAPKKTGSFRKNIASKKLKEEQGDATYVWYVKAPDHRITHLLVHGHATRTGGRTKADPFLENALSTVLPEYEKAVKEALQND